MHLLLSRSNFNQLLEAVRCSGTKEPLSTSLGSPPPAYADPLICNYLDTRLPVVNKAEYPNVKFWTRTQWAEVNGKLKTETLFNTDPDMAAGSDTKAKRRKIYVETADGAPVEEGMLSKIRLTMRSAFQELKRLKLVPDTWTRICHLGRKVYLLTVCRAHPELAFCDNFWKAEQMAIDNFPSWYTNHVRIKKESVKEEAIDAKPQSTKRQNSPLTAGIPFKKARTEIDDESLNEDPDDDNIYYNPSPAAVSQAKPVDDMVDIDNPLYVLPSACVTTSDFY